MEQKFNLLKQCEIIFNPNMILFEKQNIDNKTKIKSKFEFKDNLLKVYQQGTSIQKIQSLLNSFKLNNQLQGHDDPFYNPYGQNQQLDDYQRLYNHQINQEQYFNHQNQQQMNRAWNQQEHQNDQNDADWITDNQQEKNEQIVG